MFALEEQIIESQIEGSGIKYVLNTIPSSWTNLSLEGYPVDPAFGKMERGEKLIRFLRDQNPSGDQCFQKDIYINGSPFFDHPFDLSKQREVLHWTEEKIKQTHRTYMMRIMRKNVFLYQDLEQTLYRYYGVVKQIEAEERKYVQNTS